MVPSLFVAHGSPTLAIEDNEYARFLQDVGKQTGKPEAIVIFTAHWECDVLTVSYSDETYETIYDFGGFPDELYTIRYPAKGSTKTAALLQEMLERAGIPTRQNRTRGLDHGSWVVLRHLYPEADVPVVQVSINPSLPAKEQYQIGRSLRELGKNGVLLIGSGGTVHNLRSIVWGKRTPEAWAVEFDDWLIDKVQARDLNALFAYDTLAPHARRAVPTPEHLVPLFIAMGGGDERNTPKLLFRSYDFGTLSHICFAF